MATQVDQPPVPPQSRPANPVPIPPMRVVTKGWWTLKEERVPLEVLEQQARDEEQALEKKRKG